MKKPRVIAFIVGVLLVSGFVFYGQPLLFWILAREGSKAELDKLEPRFLYGRRTGYVHRWLDETRMGIWEDTWTDAPDVIRQRPRFDLMGNPVGISDFRRDGTLSWQHRSVPGGKDERKNKPPWWWGDENQIVDPNNSKKNAPGKAK